MTSDGLPQKHQTLRFDIKRVNIYIGVFVFDLIQISIADNFAMSV